MPDLVAHQWGRLGDLVQTGIILSRWKTQRGGRIALTYDSRYTSVVEAMNCVDDGLPIDLQHIVARTRQSDIESNSLPDIEKTLRQSRLLRGGIHLNLSRSGTAALYSHLLEPDESSGYVWDQGAMIAPCILEEYLQGLNGEPYPVHICDVWSTMAGLKCDSYPGNFIDSIHGIRERAEAKRVLVFTEAGAPGRIPPLPWIADLCSKLVQDSNVQITLACQTPGSENDELRAVKHEYGERIEDLRGKTSLVELLSLCRSHQFFVGPDTGGLHLAAAQGGITIGLYTGGASVFNTGPYCQHAFVLQNPVWSESEIRSIAALLNLKLESRDLDKSTTSNSLFWTPFLDRDGLGYVHPLWNLASKQEVEDLRRSFLQRWIKTGNDVAYVSE